MGKVISTRVAGPDDPIYKSGFTVYTPRSVRPPKREPKDEPTPPEKEEDK